MRRVIREALAEEQARKAADAHEEATAAEGGGTAQKGIAAHKVFRLMMKETFQKTVDYLGKLHFKLI